MQYTRLGNSDLNVSRICMGCSFRFHRRCSEGRVEQPYGGNE